MHRLVGSATMRGAVELPESGRKGKQPWGIGLGLGVQESRGAQS